MIALAYQKSTVELVDPGTTIMTTKGNLVVDEIAVTTEHVKVTGARSGGAGKRTVVEFPRRSDVYAIAGPADIDQIETAIAVLLALGQSQNGHGPSVEIADDTFTVTLEDKRTWTIPRRGHEPKLITARAGNVTPPATPAAPTDPPTPPKRRRANADAA